VISPLENLCPSWMEGSPMPRCPSCRNSFAAHTANQKYCSARCRERRNARRKAAGPPSEKRQAERLVEQGERFCGAMIAAGYRQCGND
jgi:hypothetical protein